eukprot:1022908-Rhodomonas_salina.1
MQPKRARHGARASTALTWPSISSLRAVTRRPRTSTAPPAEGVSTRNPMRSSLRAQSECESLGCLAREDNGRVEGEGEAERETRRGERAPGKRMAKRMATRMRMTRGKQRMRMTERMRMTRGK